MIQRVLVALFFAALLVRPSLAQQDDQKETKAKPADAQPSQPDSKAAATQPNPAQPPTSNLNTPARDTQPDSPQAASTAAPTGTTVPSAAPDPGPVTPAAPPQVTAQPGVPAPAGGAQLQDNSLIIKQLAEIKAELAALKTWSWVKDLGPTTVAFLALVASSIISAVSLSRNATLARQALQAKAHEEERKAIREKRDRFYGPYTQLRGVSKHLYEIFNARRTEDERKQFTDAEGKFRTLIALCRGHEFKDPIDQVLLAEIVRIGEESATLITKEIGLVDNPQLQTELSRAATHYRIIKLAAEGKLKTTGDEFHKFSFPKDVDKLIGEQITKLDARLRELEDVFGSSTSAAQKAGKSA